MANPWASKEPLSNAEFRKLLETPLPRSHRKGDSRKSRGGQNGGKVDGDRPRKKHPRSGGPVDDDKKKKDDKAYRYLDGRHIGMFGDSVLRGNVGWRSWSLEIGAPDIFGTFIECAEMLTWQVVCVSCLCGICGWWYASQSELFGDLLVFSSLIWGTRGWELGVGIMQWRGLVLQHGARCALWNTTSNKGYGEKKISSAAFGDQLASDICIQFIFPPW